MHESSFFAGISCITMCDILLYVFGEWYVYVLLRTFRCCMYDWILAAPDTFPPHYLGILEPSVFDSLLLLLSHNKDLTTLSFFFLLVDNPYWARIGTVYLCMVQCTKL